MRESPTLLVMAAGMGSRYGGLKQIEPVGPSGEIVIDYSVYDAIRAGFGEVVFIIRRDIEADFRGVIDRHIAGRIPVRYVFQELSDIPAGYRVPENRTKPWGTGHAILAAREAIRTPFAVINADDFYGASSFRTLAGRLRETAPSSTDYCLVAYVARNTLSDHGSVSRGICRIEGGRLQEVVERLDIERHGDAARFRVDGQWIPMTGDEPVSMNMWGFTPTLFTELAARLPAFLDRAMDDPKAEFLIPEIIDDLIQSGACEVYALHSEDRWMGVTYPEDKPAVAGGIRALVDAGAYPETLWA